MPYRCVVASLRETNPFAPFATFCSKTHPPHPPPKFPTHTQLVKPQPPHPCAHLIETGEYWTSRQRQAAPLHEISYRACFKPQLPAYFITRHTTPGDLVYDPFAGRGTTAIEAALLGRRVAINDINPLTRILTEPRLELPSPAAIRARLDTLAPLLAANDTPPTRNKKLETRNSDLLAFYSPRTLRHIHALRAYLHERRATATEDAADRWLRMVATNRLTGHSPGFFSVYTLPPNQAASPKRQLEINRQRNQTPPERDILALIWKKTLQLHTELTPAQIANLHAAARTAQYFTVPAGNAEFSLGKNAKKNLGAPRDTSAPLLATRYPLLATASVSLTITSPPFLDTVQYAADNWLRCWFNHIDPAAIANQITTPRTLEAWDAFIRPVFRELHRITRPGGHVAFEVGEIRKGTIRLEETVVPAAETAGFTCQKILINEQTFTKTANIWGVTNNTRGTNTNRIVLLQKPK